METKVDTKKLAPPYLSWKTFTAYLASMRQAIPPRIDKTMMAKLSGINQTLMMSTLTYLKLIDQNGTPSVLLTQLIDASTPEKRNEFQSALRKVLQAGYPFLFDTSGPFDLAKSSPGDFDKKFESEGISGQTVRKCEAFFIAAAKDAAIKLSPYILDIKRRGPKKGSSPKQKGTKEKGDNSGGYTPLPVRSGGGENPPVALPKWYENFEPVFKKLPDANKSPHWTQADRDKWLAAFSALLDLYIEVDVDEQK